MVTFINNIQDRFAINVHDIKAHSLVEMDIFRPEEYLQTNWCDMNPLARITSFGAILQRCQSTRSSFLRSGTAKKIEKLLGRWKEVLFVKFQNLCSAEVDF